uniref:Protocadherin 2 alpha a 15 n=1 Tax=Myripristis murdjan TaxID=586833 RepID=A0A667WI05_9TELE
MEQRGRRTRQERRQWIAYMLTLVTFWSAASAQIRYSMSEEMKEGTVVGNVAKDLGLDKSTLKERGYRIVYGSTEPPFRVNQDDGILYVNRKIDREEVCDRSKVCLINLKTVLENPLEVHYVAVEILDVNDHSPSFPENEKVLEIFESALPGARFQLQAARDADSGPLSVQQYKLSQNEHFRLEVKDRGENRKTPSLILQKSLDRESVKTHALLLTAVDGGEPSLSSEKTISIFVSDVNDNCPEFLLNPYSFYITENNAPGDFVFSVKASDRDEGDNAFISYHILRDSRTENSLTSFLNINSENGNILALKTFDFETVKTFQFQVVATDSGTPSLSSNVTVNVFILDQNDNGPVILYPVSANGSAEGVEEIPRNVNAGHLVTKVRAYDPDIGYNGWLLFSLQEVSDHSLFGLERYTGQIRTLRSFTETDETEHKLVILVKDNGNISLSATATVIVKAVEPKEAFAASDTKGAAKDEEESNVTFYLMITLASVSALFLISIIVLIVMQCSKPTDYSSKYLQDTNYDGTLCHTGAAPVRSGRPGDRVAAHRALPRPVPTGADAVPASTRSAGSPHTDCCTFIINRLLFIRGCSSTTDSDTDNMVDY